MTKFTQNEKLGATGFITARRDPKDDSFVIDGLPEQDECPLAIYPNGFVSLYHRDTIEVLYTQRIRIDEIKFTVIEESEESV